MSGFKYLDIYLHVLHIFVCTFSRFYIQKRAGKNSDIIRISVYKVLHIVNLPLTLFRVHDFFLRKTRWRPKSDLSPTRYEYDSVEVLPVYHFSLVTRIRMYIFKTANVNIIYFLVSSFTLRFNTGWHWMVKSVAELHKSLICGYPIISNSLWCWISVSSSTQLNSVELTRWWTTIFRDIKKKLNKNKQNWLCTDPGGSSTSLLTAKVT